MSVQDICLFKIYVRSRYMSVQDICLFKIYVCSRYMSVQDICLFKIYVCSRYMSVQDICPFKISKRKIKIKIFFSHFVFFVVFFTIIIKSMSLFFITKEKDGRYPTKKETKEKQ